MNDPQQHEEKDELAQLAMGVLLMAFAVVAVAVMLTMQVSSVLGR